MNDQDIEDSYPLSPLQQGMLFHDLYTPHSGMYLQQLVSTFHEKMNVTAFKKAWLRVIARHPVLRTSFHWEGINEPLQKVHKHSNLRWVEEDWRAMPLKDQNHRLETYLQNDRQQGFKLTEAPLMRLALFQMGDADYRFILTSHHAIKDGRSRSILLNEVFSFYEAFCRGKDIKLKHPRPYRAYIDWFTKEDFNRAEDFWRRMLESVNTHTPVVVDSISYSTSDKTWEEYQKQETRLSENLTRALQSVAKQHGLTPNTIFQGAWALLLSRYSGEQDVVFGATRACRRSGIKGAESMVGLFINNLPLRISVAPNTQLLPWLKEIRSKWIAMRDYEHTPIIKIQKWSDMPAGTPLFESILSFENYDLTSAMQAQGGKWVNREFDSITFTNFPIAVVGYLGSGLLVEIVYNRSRFEDRTITRMLGHIEVLLESIIANPEQRLSAVRMLTEVERRQILVDWNNTSCGYPRDKCLHQLFEQQVEQTPDAVAVVCKDEQLSYRQLNARANQLAHYLKSFGVGPEVLVGICLERCLEMVIAVLGILKAGGAYVPLDPEYPPERLAFILSDIQAPVLLTQQSLLGRLPEQAEHIICLDTDWATIEQEDGTEPTADTNARNLAYIIYTSGSTGKPKGVMIPHAAICNHMLWMLKEFAFEQSERVLQKTPFTFDASVWEFYAPLISGGQLVLAKPEGHRDSTYLVNAIIDNSITTLQVVPSQLHMLLNEKRFENCLTLRRVFCGGEALTVELFNQFMARLPSIELINLYGPAEATIDTIFWRCHQQHDRPLLPIGRPIGNMQVYILDQHLNPVPVGVQGELHIAGPGIGRGYLNRPDLTAEKFVSNPFPPSVSTRGDPRNGEDKMEGRLYKSGDIARYLPNGIIEFIGRSDYQVKIHGFRIELGEVKSVLGRHPAVEAAVVIAREDVPGDKRLVAYVVASHALTPTFSELRSFLKEKLPDYMIPSAYVYIGSLPLTPNGKVDRRALPAPKRSRSELEAVYVAPQSEVERIVAEVWQQVLRIEQVGMHDNFFDLGGDSLLLIQIHNKFQELFKKEIPIADIFRYPTIKALADYLAQEESDRVSIQQTSDSIEKLTVAKNRMKQLYKRRQQTKAKR
jgi:amino acid adenylation domain-containing protein